ncbi:hypothetical protein CDL15_Pgr018824 [Punica granatum]|nr:hypothetical protein CDL15_Pgr018824 [Punica granatum]
MVDPIVVLMEDRDGEDTVEAVRVDVEAIIEPIVGSAEVNGRENRVETSGNIGGTVGDACQGTDVFTDIDRGDLNLKEIDKLTSSATMNANTTSVVNELPNAMEG